MDLMTRRRMMINESLPYDSKVEYIKSTGTQYIDTGVILDNSLWKCETIVSLNGSQDAGILCSLTSGNMRFYLLDTAPGLFRVCNFGGSWNSAKVLNSSGIAYNIFYKVVSTIGNGSVTISLNDGAVSTRNVNEGFNEERTLKIFSRTAGAAFAKASIKYMKISRDGVLVRDYIPVRVGQVGYMYDKISKQLFGNSGSGSFDIGNDIN